MKVAVGVSMRHVHLTQETYDKLFAEALNSQKPLNQIGEFASDKVVTLKTEKNILEKVRIVGPLRSYDQVELSKTDCYFLGINAPVRESGMISSSPGITIVGPKGEVVLDQGVIISERHVHLNRNDAKGFNNGQKLLIKIDTIKSGYLEAVAKITDNGYFELHLDTDDANAFLLANGSEVEIIEKSKTGFLGEHE